MNVRNLPLITRLVRGKSPDLDPGSLVSESGPIVFSNVPAWLLKIFGGSLPNPFGYSFIYLFNYSYIHPFKQYLLGIQCV